MITHGGLQPEQLCEWWVVSFTEIGKRWKEGVGKQVLFCI